VLARLIAQLEKDGYRATGVPFARLEELRESYAMLRRGGALDEGFAAETLRGLTFDPPEEVAEPRSVVVVAARDPVVLATFRWRGSDVDVPVPPTYLHFRRRNADIVGVVQSLLPAGRSAASMGAPKKLLAVRSGLARYGRNNVAYVPGLGSFHQLATVCTDLPCEGGRWCEPALMDACERCHLCASACPTGAIPEDRILLKGERCVTYWNEKPSEIPFPDWMSEDAHDSLVGCLRCQLACPENSDVRGEMARGPRFDEAETAALLASDKVDLPPELEKRLTELGLLDFLDVIPRNLSVLLREA
jgi:epoxyqueuosine reductase